MALKFLNDGYFAGKVGIGTASPGGKLDITYTGTGGSGTQGIGEGLNITSLTPNITFNDTSSNVNNYAIHLNQNVLTLGRYTSATSQSPDLVLESGNVGIGTTSPLSKLTIDAPVGNFANGTNAISLNYDGGSSPGDVGGGIVFSQKWWSGSAGQQVTGGIFGIKHGGNGSYGGGLGFYTQPNGAGNMAQHMVIRSTGEVGIGTTSPKQKLHVSGGTTAGDVTKMVIGATGGNAESYLYLAELFSGDNVNYGFSFVADGNSSNNLLFKRHSNSTSGTTVMEIRRDNDQIRFNGYNSTNQTGTPTYLLGTDASGNIVKTNTVPGSGAGPYLPLSAGSGKSLTGTLYGTNTNWSGDGDYAGNLTLGTGASTQEAHLQIGQGRTGNGYSYIDLIGDATYTDYGFRVIRNNTGANTSSAIIHRGTGNLEIQATDSASILLRTNNVTALTLSNTQTATFAGDIRQLTSTQKYINGSYLEIGTGKSNTAQFTFNADYDGGQTDTYTPNYSGNSSAGMTVVKMPSGGVGGLDFFVKNHGTTSGSHALSTFTKILELNQNGNSTFAGLVSGITPTAAANFVTKAYADGLTPGAGVFLPLAGNTNATAMTGNIILANTQQVRFLTSANAVGLRLQTSAAGNSFIDNEVSDMYIRQEADGNDMIFQADDGSGGNATYFRLDGGSVTTQFLKTVKLYDNVALWLGDENDLQIYHDGSNSYIDNSTGALLIRELTNDADVIIQSDNGGGGLADYFRADGSTGSSILYNYGNQKLQTTSTGISVTGDIQIDSALLSNQENTDVDTGTETIANVAIATYTAAFFDFVIKKTTNVRSGTVYACHDGTNVEFTETSTQDLGDTSDVTLSVDISGGNMRLRATTTSDDWSVKSLIRAI